LVRLKLSLISRDELVDLVGKLMRAESTDIDQQAWLDLIECSVPCPAGQVTGLIYWPPDGRS
jgi:hypothetical protein